MTGGSVEVISSKGCSRLFVGSSNFLPNVNGFRFMAMMSPAPSSLSESTVPVAHGPFTGLVICVTGLSKEARKEVMAATERLGGRYSASLHPQCTHLVVQSLTGRKFDHAIQHGTRNGLFIVTLGWFVDSVKRNVRLSETLYSVKSIGKNGLPLGESDRQTDLPGSEKSCLPIPAYEDNFLGRGLRPPIKPPNKEHTIGGPVFSNNLIYIDSEISDEMKKKVVEAAAREGANFIDNWFIGCHASHVVCEGPSIQRYIGHANNLVTPLWILKTAREKCMQRLVHLSADLAKQVKMSFENAQIAGEVSYGGSIHPTTLKSKDSSSQVRVSEKSLEGRLKTVELAKLSVRNRRGRRMQSCQVPIHPFTPNNLLESICWTISEPTSSARIYTESSWTEDACEQHISNALEAGVDGRDSEALLENFSRLLSESEKRDIVFKSHFLTILFPIDRFGELGSLSRTYFNDDGFSCIQILEHIYNFYQENMSADEINLAIHSDSRHADRLRSLYSSKESVAHGFVAFKRVDFIGSRRSFEKLKRVSGENNGNLYELLIRA